MNGGVRQQIIVTGLGGQGVLLTTRVLAECAAAVGVEVITSETHGMAQRGGSVISMVKAGPFRGPLIAEGQADVGLFLDHRTAEVHRHYLSPTAVGFVNGPDDGRPGSVDAAGAARAAGTPGSANLVLLGYAASSGLLFCDVDTLERVVARLIRGRAGAGAVEAVRAGAALGGR